MPPVRKVARVIILDPREAVLLVRYEEDGVSYWVPPGGALEAGEDYKTAALRELSEETGLSAAIGSELWERRFELSMPTGTVDQIERYFAVHVDQPAPEVRNSSPEPILEHRWWNRYELARSEETIYPEGLAESLERMLGRSRAR